MEFSANDIASLLNGEVEGNGNVKVSNISKIDQSLPGTLTFLSNPTYTKYIYTTTASIVIVNKDFVAESSLACTLIRVEDAYVALAKLLDFYTKSKPSKIGIEQPSFVSSSATIGEQIYLGAFAYVGDNALIGNNVKIYPHVYIGDNVKIGNDTILYSGVKIYAGCTVGASCIFHSGSVIGADGFGFAPNPDGTYTKIEQIGNVVIEDNVEIGANTTVDSA
ncbi:MAG TPA: UDP-3-O-(3-hydroxymyristoyl)glucosamine N-acyltransferase, partial [Prolixibacteraceae bacterium]